MKLARDEAKILAMLFKASDGLEAFTIYKRLRFTYGIYFSLITSLTTKELIAENNEKINITVKGKEILLSGRYGYLLDPKKHWRDIPKEFLIPSIEKNSFYIPSLSRLDTRHFKKD